MARHHLVRVGAMGHVGHFTAADATLYPRGRRVVLRTLRGLEVGEVLSGPNPAATGGDSEGAILRALTDQDELLQTRLQQHRHEAFDACVRLLEERSLMATLLDVEPTFDGRRLYFYFLGEVDPRVESLTQELAEVYDTTAGMDGFAETLEGGCGPGCGTDAAAGGRCEGCTTCAVAVACGNGS